MTYYCEETTIKSFLEKNYNSKITQKSFENLPSFITIKHFKYNDCSVTIDFTNFANAANSIPIVAQIFADLLISHAQVVENSRNIIVALVVDMNEIYNLMTMKVLLPYTLI